MQGDAPAAAWVTAVVGFDGFHVQMRESRNLLLQVMEGLIPLLTVGLCLGLESWGAENARTRAV